MPRPKKPGAPEPKKRSRNGCWPCKARKVKCGEERPNCVNCLRTGDTCDYSIRLNWERGKKKLGSKTILRHTPLSSTSFSTSFHYHRPLADSKSISSTSTAIPTHITDAQSPNSITTFSGIQQDTAPPSEGPAGTSLASPGPGLLGRHFQGPARCGSDQPPLCSSDSAGPILSPHEAYSSSVKAVTRTYASLSDAGSQEAVCPPSPKRPTYILDFGSPHEPRKIDSSSESTSASVTPRFLNASVGIGLRPGTNAAVSPLTPAASSPYSDGERQPPPSSHGTVASPDIRRLSVNSLLSGPPGPVAGPYAPPSERAVNARTTLCLSQVTSYYGVDPGFKDLDQGKNDDFHAIMKPFQGSTCHDDLSAVDFVLVREEDSTATSRYYDKPVPIRIPQDLEPLPTKLRENPMNLLYFHHFMNHTAKVLVPHDDEQSNPYRHVLPRMAVQNDNLLSLMLAYSASHRAHLLDQPEPATRIAHWVQDIFPALRAALNDPKQKISNANIATGIMLASLEIVSPTAFGYQIPWQQHLGLARELIASRPDGIRWTRSWTQEDQVRAFLWSWLAYLDVLGTLSGGRRESSTAWILDYQRDDYDEEFDEIDCIMGMTTRCVYILAKIAELAKECDGLRAAGGSSTIDEAGREWRPPEAIIMRAEALKNEANNSMALRPQPCKHLHASGGVARWDQKEIAALNESFHWAGLVHLHRRVLGRPSAHDDVQLAVWKIHLCIDCISMAGNTEANLLFPLFTAACETSDERKRGLLIERLKSMGRCGFLQVNKARLLIEKVWDTGQSWDDLLANEFIG